MSGYRLLLLAALLALLSGCGRNMYDQAKFGTYDASPFYTDGASARPLLENTVSRSRGEVDAGYYTGQSPDGIAAELPFELTEAVLERGQERYNIYCAPCHNYSGNGQGMIVQKGFVQPTSFQRPAPARLARGLLLRGRDQRLRTDVLLRFAHPGRRSLGHRGLYQSAAILAERAHLSSSRRPQGTGRFSDPNRGARSRRAGPHLGRGSPERSPNGSGRGSGRRRRHQPDARRG